MAKKLNRTAVRNILADAKNVIGYDFRLIVSKKKSGKYSATIAGRNGEIVMHQETVNQKASAEYIAARIISGGLRAKYIEVESAAKPKKAKEVSNV
jgi:uncharacterized protein YegP (UPF0339 family)